MAVHSLFCCLLAEAIYHNRNFLLDTANFDHGFACQSLLGLPVNSTEELIFISKNFFNGLNGKF